MPNTYGGAISQGINQGLQNVSAMYGLKNQVRQSQREDELYNIKMKEYQKGLEPADWGKIGNFLDAGEEGLGYAKAYAGALGKDPDKMTRSDMREFGEIFLKDQKAAHDILQFRRRHYGQKVKEYEGKPGLESEYGMFKEKFDQATMLDKTYREAQSFRQEQEQIQKATQAMQKVASMSDEELSLKGYPPIMRDMAASGDIQGFRSIAGKIAEAQVKSPTEFERYKKMPPAERKEYDEFKGAGKKESETWGPEEAGPGGTKRQVSATGKVSTTYKPPTTLTIKPPAGYRYNANDELEPIPGGPAERKLKTEKATDDTAFGSSVAELDRMQRQAEDLLKRPLGRITGVVGKVPSIPGSEAANAEAQLETLKSQIGFNVLQAMRSMSKTGGALGQVSEKENEYLQQNLASLKQAQSEAELKASLDRIINYAKDSKIRLKKAYDAKWSEPGTKGKIGRFTIEVE